MKKLSILLLTLYIGLPLGAYVESPPPFLKEAIADSFPLVSENDIRIETLNGGLSQAALYKLHVQDKTYVARVLQCLELNNQDALELFCMVEGAKKRISPQILYVSPDNKMIIMEYVEGKTLDIDQANSPENIVKLARAFREAHTITGHCKEGETRLSKATRCTESVFNYSFVEKQDILNAFALVKTYSHELSKYPIEKIALHGDLNPRNIFLKDDHVYLIDWAETVVEDPFYDLTYFSLKHGYNKDRERLLLTIYLDRSPTETEWERFNLHKKIHHAFWSLTDLYLANEALKRTPDQCLEKKSSLQDWHYYQRIFADNTVELSAQYFYDLSRLNYQLAQP